VTDAAIHRVSEDVDGKLRFVTFPTFTFHPSIFTLPPYIGSQWIATGYALAMTRVVGFVVRRGRTVRVYISLFTVQTSLLKSRRSVRLAPRGFRPAWAKTPLAPLHY
jgi:hypothetical protein